MHGGLVSRFIHSQKKGAEELNLPHLFSFLRARFVQTAPNPAEFTFINGGLRRKKGDFKRCLIAFRGAVWYNGRKERTEAYRVRYGESGKDHCAEAQGAQHDAACACRSARREFSGGE